MAASVGARPQGRGRALRRMAREAVVWLYIPGAVHAAVILLLMHLQFLVVPPVKREAVIDTALEEIDIRDNPVEPLAPTNVKTSAVAEKRLDWRELLKPDTSQVPGPDERNILKMLDAREDEPLTLQKISVPVDGLTSIPRMGGAHEMKSSVAAVVDALSRELAKMLTTRNVLLVWIFDESQSMRQSQREVRERIAKVYEELQGATTGGGAKLVSAVVGYGLKPHFLLEDPTADAARVQAAIDRIPLDTSGQENVMAACRDVVEKYRQYARAQRRILVVFVVTDEMGDDTEHLERVIALVKQGGVRVFVLGGEARFQQRLLFPWHLSPQAPAAVHNLSPNDPQRRPWTVPAAADVGPECAFPETLYGYDFESPWYGWKGMSGFGYWALSRLAKESGGVYYLLFGEKGPSYDPAVMEPYAPELVSRDEYIERCKGNQIRAVIHRMRDLLSEVPFSWPGVRTQMTPRQVELSEQWPFYGRINLDNMRRDLDLAKQMADRRIKQLNEIIAVLESGTLADAPFAPRRWEANREMALADAYALRWSAQQYFLAVQDFVQRPRLASEALYYYVGSTGLSSTKKYPILGGPKAQETLREVYARYDAVIANHPGTPWADQARRERRIAFYQMEPYFEPRGGSPTPPAPPPPKI